MKDWLAGAFLRLNASSCSEAVAIAMDERLQMVDAQGWATARDPVYWDLYEIIRVKAECR